jgi:TldD protein
MSRLSLTRRTFVQQCAGLAAGMALPHGARAWNGDLLRTPARVPDPHVDVRALALRAVDAARSAGATYADVRLTRTLQRQLDILDNIPNAPFESEDVAVGVRALVDGVWGFVASPDWTMDEMVRLGRAAAQQARANGFGQRGGVAWEPVSAVTGTWEMPVTHDPFAMSVDEQLDYIHAVHGLVRQARRTAVAHSMLFFTRQDKTFASTDGSLVQQTLYLTSGGFSIALPSDARHDRSGSAGYDGLSPCGRGWEEYRNAGLMERIPALLETAEVERRRPIVPVELGRYDVVFDTAATAALLDETIGAATELDRAFGMEANASGTSYLTDPLAMLGTTRIGVSGLTVSANRSQPGAAATVKWDDDGVTPEEFTLVDDGMLADFQTTRDQAAWLAPWYHKTNRPVRSHGCANAPSAMFVAMQHTPNLRMHPAPADASFETLVAQVGNGVAIRGGRVRVEQQRLNGSGEGAMYRIRDGKLAEQLDGGGYLFRAPQLWGSVRALGGASSLQWIGRSRAKGQPVQGSFHSVAAVTMHVGDVRLIEMGRRA